MPMYTYMPMYSASVHAWGHQVSPKDQIQIFRLGSISLYPLSYLAGL